MEQARHRLPRQALAALAGALFTLASSAKHEVITPTPYYKSINSFDLAQIGYAGVQGRVVHGDPFGDLVGAMFFVVDGEVLWSPLPYALTSVAPLGAGVNATDLAVMRDSQDRWDVLVLTNPNGLSVAAYDQTEGAFAITPLPGTDLWASATQLRRSVLPDGTLALSGLRSNGSTVLVAHVDETGETLLFPVTTPVPVLAHDLIDYHGDGGTDVAVVTTQGCFVFSSTGFLLRREMVDLQAGGVVTFEAQGKQRLAFWYQDVSPGRSHLRVIDGPLTEPDFTLVAVPPGGSTEVDVRPSFAMAGDYDGDQNQDLLLQIHSLFCVLLFNQSPPGAQPPLAQFSVSSGAYDAIGLWDQPHLATEPGAALAYFGNVDSEPGDDLIVPIDELDRIELFTRYGLLGTEEAMLLGSESGDLVAEQTTYWWHDGPVDDEAHLNLALDVPAEYLPGGAQEFEYLQVATWFQDGPSKEFTFVRSEQNNLHRLKDDDQHQWTRVEALRDGVLLQGDFWPNGDNIWVLFRFVDADDTVAPIRIERASHFVIGAFTLTSVDGGESIPPYLGTIGGAGEELDLELWPEPHPSAVFPPVGSNYVGAWVPQTSSILFPPGDVPQFRPLVNSNWMETY